MQHCVSWLQRLQVERMTTMPARPNLVMRTCTFAANILRERHLLRGVAYFGIAATVLQTVGQHFPEHQPYSREQFNLVVLPLALAVTRAFVALRPDDTARWIEVDLPREASQVAYGAALGTAAILGTLWIAWAKKWVSAPAWGWAQVEPAILARSMAFITAGHLAVACSEELVFRGYGYMTLRRALPAPLAGSGVTVLFALAHPLTLRTLVGEAALGLTLLALRIHSDGIWLPIGYHWAGNVLQTAVFGPVEGPPSLRPLHVHGPSVWVGRPGHPEPGVLSTVVNLALALGIALYTKAQRQ